MIVNHRYRFIFLKTQKTAGTSIEIALSKFCDAGDIMTPISPADEETRRSLGYRGAQNYELPLSQYSKTDLLRRFLRGRHLRYYNHMHAAEISAWLPTNVWNDYFKLTVERNPWDKVVSRYYWDHRNEQGRPAFSDYVANGNAHRASSFEIYSLRGRIAANHVMRYERLQTELEQISKRLNLPDAIELPRTKAASRPTQRKYQSMYGEAERRTVDIMFAREIAAFGYRFEESPEGATEVSALNR